MDFIHSLVNNVISPPFLFFLLGLTAGFLKSELDIPDQISRYFSIYLIVSIGFKGGCSMNEIDLFNMQILLVFLIGFFASLLMPFLAFRLLKYTTHLDQVTAAAVAAHYGSISMVTFVTALNYLEQHGIAYENHMIAVLAIMEAPAIFTGLYLANRSSKTVLASSPKKKSQLMREIFINGSILLLAGSFLIGWACGPTSLHSMKGFIQDPFQGVLCLFLLDMGLVVSRQLPHLRNFKPSLIAFGFYMPIIGAIFGLSFSVAIGLSVGSGLLLTTLLASASYIAVTAAMRLTLPQAQAGIYIPLSLAITFPFNMSIGLPLYIYFAKFYLTP